jgi:hypothetical protein
MLSPVFTHVLANASNNDAQNHNNNNDISNKNMNKNRNHNHNENDCVARRFEDCSVLVIQQ